MSPRISPSALGFRKSLIAGQLDNATMVVAIHAGVAELADARDSKSRALHWACGFDPHLQHQIISFI